MFNVVTDVEGTAGAVLIRAVKMLGANPESTRCDGPGKLTRALGLNMNHNRVDLLSSEELYVSGGPGSRRVVDNKVLIGPRIGVDYAGAWTAAPLRFAVVD